MATVSVDPPELPRPPAAGKGRGDGKGTYRSNTRGNYVDIVRSPQNNRGGGDGSAVAEPEGDAPLLALDKGEPPGDAPPPGLDNGEPEEDAPPPWVIRQ